MAVVTVHRSCACCERDADGRARQPRGGVCVRVHAQPLPRGRERQTRGCVAGGGADTGQAAGGEDRAGLSPWSGGQVGA